MKKQRQEETRAMSAAKAAAGLTFHASGRVDAVVAAARLAEIPRDTRNLTQRLMGDPIPGRDALSRRNHGAVE